VAKPVIVVLGHPTAAAHHEVAENTGQLIAGLKGFNLNPVIWKDGWRTPSAREGSSAPSQTRTLFVQPVGPFEAGDYADKPDVVRKWLKDAATADMTQSVAGMPPFRLVIWLPSKLSDPDFEAKLASAQPGECLTLKHDDSLTLATWLNVQVSSAERSTIAVLALVEELTEVDDSRKLRDDLHRSFYKIIDEEVNPATERWPFPNGETLVRQLKVLDTDRVIIAIHDLNTGHARKLREAQEELRQKLSWIEDAVRDAGRDDLKYFRSALLVSKADTLPWVTYPSPSEFEDWRLLPFVSKGNALEPKAALASTFRAHLRLWARDAA
jgi:hypothetical protein